MRLIWVNFMVSSEFFYVSDAMKQLMHINRGVENIEAMQPA